MYESTSETTYMIDSRTVGARFFDTITIDNTVIILASKHQWKVNISG